MLQITKLAPQRALAVLVALFSLPLSAHGLKCSVALYNMFDPRIQPVGRAAVVDTHSSFIEKATLPLPVKPIIENFGPFGQPSAVQVFPGGSLGVFGTLKAVQMASNEAIALKGAVSALTGTTEKRIFEYDIEGTRVVIETASSLVGSARQKRLFSDVDAELTMVVRYEGFKEADFHNPESIFAKAVEKHVIGYVQDGEASGMIFSEAKSGSLDHVSPEAHLTKSTAVKWRKEDLLKGEQRVYSETHGKHVTMTLREGLTSHSRLKFDWFTRIGVPQEMQDKFGGMTTRVVEGSVMLNLAGQSGGNSPVPFISQVDSFPDLGATGGHISIDSFGDNKPLKITALFFSEADYELARSVTVSGPFTPVEYLGRAVVNAARTYREQGKLFKSLRILFTRLIYATDVEHYRLAMADAGITKTADDAEIVTSFRAIVENPLVNEISVLLSSAKDLLKIKSMGFDTRADEAALFKAIALYSGPLNINIKDLSESNILKIQESFDRLVIEMLNEHPGLKSYVDYVLLKSQNYSKPQALKEAVFVSYTPTKSFLDKYDARLKVWKELYPNLVFENRQDLHMTLAFLGNLSAEQRIKAQGALEEFAKSTQDVSLDFADASFRKVGRGKNDAIIALHFDPEQVDPRLKAAVIALRKAMLRIGMPADRRLEEFVPHITLCTLPPYLQGKVEHADLARFLANENPLDMGADAVTSEVRVLFREREDPTPIEPVYRSLELDPREADVP